MSSESDGEYSEIEEEPRLKYKRIGNNILGLVRSRSGVITTGQVRWDGDHPMVRESLVDLITIKNYFEIQK